MHILNANFCLFQFGCMVYVLAENGAWPFQSSTIDYYIFTAQTLIEAPASFSGLAHTSVTTSLWIVSDGDDDEVFMEHCYVAWCQCRPARHPLQIGPRNYLPAQAELSSDSVSFFLSMHRLGKVLG